MSSLLSFSSSCPHPSVTRGISSLPLFSWNTASPYVSFLSHFLKNAFPLPFLHSLLPQHSDYGCLTLLNMDESTQALQARNTQGAWIFADPIPGTLLVNIGDMLSRWSNGKFKSTPHRVLPAVGKARISIPFFFEPNLDTLVVPLRECENYARAHGKIYSSVLFADHLRSKVTNNFSFLEPSPTATPLTGSKVHTVDGKGSERH
ncbi:2-oxoglutarate-fe -dependent oxygenase domain-containing protein [Nannochloropsis gaditana]|uniref:2-oxoglutarate-fe-dependent oxygenase domain-containing protein n=1 Tax=Nannochloropsis gaditana TaxID=72520 RepID=W7TAQ1_9STRA|nr:2-oxoglutarate-fe -dependent oxygenase domain-containing protein [Nannochloropsis gaditana]